jgi:crotonobetainyl-CoA:carnitine CoA-transferase CaiB-like acyl-CoA transferase
MPSTPRAPRNLDPEAAAAQGATSLSLLSGTRVAQCGGTVAAAAAGALLRRLGATVTIVRTPEFAGSARGSQRRCVEVLNHAKNTVASPAFGAPGASDLMLGFDACLTDISGTRFHTTEAGTRDYCRVVADLGHPAWVTISPYGLTGPRKNDQADELTLAAASSLSYFTRGADGRPLKPAAHGASIVAGHMAAVAALHALWLSRSEGGIHHFDLSAQEAVIVTGTTLEVAHDLFGCPGPRGTNRHVPPRGLYRCRVGSIYIVLPEDYQWRNVVRAMQEPEWARGLTTKDDRVRNRELVEQNFADWVSQFSAKDCMQLLQLHGVPATTVNSCADLISDEGMSARSYFEKISTSTSTYELTPGSPAVVELVSVEDPPLQEPRRPRVLDASHVLAGPLAASWLGTMGMDVVRVESSERPDLYRRTGPFPSGVPDLERSAYFAAVNFSKRSIGIPPDAVAARELVTKLAAAADIVLENVGPKRASAIGLGPELMGGEQPRPRLLVSSSGWGGGTPCEMFRAYGQNVHAYSGMTHLTRDEDGHVATIGTAWADPMTAIWMTALAMASVINPSVKARADISMVEVVAYQFPEYFSYLQREGEDRTSPGDRLDYAILGGVYQGDDSESWLAIGVHEDTQLVALSEVLGFAPEDLGHGYSPDDAEEARIEADLRAAIANWDTQDLAQKLRARGVPADVVSSSRDLTVDPHLAQRGLFQTVVHPVWGSGRLAGLPWRAYGCETPVFRLQSPPLLGGDTVVVTRDWLAPLSDPTDPGDF